MTPSQYISKAWNLVQSDLGVFLGGVLLMMLIGGAFPILLMGPAMVGIMYVSLRALRGQPYEFSDLFKGFDFFGESIIAFLLVLPISLSAAFCCVIPVLFIYPFLLYPYAFVVDKKMSGVDAFKASWNLVKADYGRHLVFFLLMVFWNLIGILLCCVGVFVTSAVMTVAVAVAYNDLVPKEEETSVAAPMAP